VEPIAAQDLFSNLALLAALPVPKLAPDGAQTKVPAVAPLCAQGAPKKSPNRGDRLRPHAATVGREERNKEGIPDSLFGVSYFRQMTVGEGKNSES
jgi:hypothetical protein